MQANRYLTLAREAVEDDPPEAAVAAKMLSEAIALAGLLAAIAAVEPRDDPCYPSRDPS